MKCLRKETSMPYDEAFFKSKTLHTKNFQLSSQYTHSFIPIFPEKFNSRCSYCFIVYLSVFI